MIITCNIVSSSDVHSPSKSSRRGDLKFCFKTCVAMKFVDDDDDDDLSSVTCIEC